MKNSGNSLYDRHQNFSIWPFRSWEIKAQRCLPSLKIMTILDTLKFRHPVLCVLRHEHFDIWSIILRVRLQQYYKNSKYLRRELSWTLALQGSDTFMRFVLYHDFFQWNLLVLILWEVTEKSMKSNLGKFLRKFNFKFLQCKKFAYFCKF